MKSLMRQRLGFLMAAVVVGVGALAMGADVTQPVIPDGLKGFSGTLTGTVVSAQSNGLGFVLKVTSAAADASSKASDAQSAAGQSLLINVQWEKGSSGSYHPKGVQVKYVKSLQAGQTTKVAVVNDEKSRLHIIGVPATQPAGN